MSAQSIINITSNSKLSQDLIALVKKSLEIDACIESYTADRQDIEKNALELGLKKSEFKSIVKWLKNSELLMNELAFLEALTVLEV